MSRTLPTLRTAKLLARTVRHLRWEQGFWRLWYKAYKPTIDPRPAPSFRLPRGEWAAPAPRPQSLIGAQTFRFLNHVGTVKTALDWNNPAEDKLWLYNLHYFDDLNAPGAGDRQPWHQDLVMRWLADNPPGHGNGWEPYPTSLRMVNWIKWFLAGNRPLPVSVDSLWAQLSWVRKRLEYQFLGNHLFANAKALVFAGTFFEGRAAAEWARKGVELVQKELIEQVLHDGGHFERSPMYHLIILEDLLDLINMRRAYHSSVPDDWTGIAAKMLRWAAEMRHPDGEVPFFNDTAIGVAAPPGEVIAYARRLGVRAAAEATAGRVLKLFPDSGYAKLANPGCTTFFDVAPVGPEYLTAHAHADTLSIEVSLGSQRVLVNSGTSIYGTSAERQRQRSTTAHNTIEIDGENSSEVWAGFRVARRAYPRDVQVQQEWRGVYAWHDGYSRLSGKPRHCRWVRLDDRLLLVQDRITGTRSHAVAGRFHLHPDVRAQRVGHEECGATFTLSLESREPAMELVITGPVSVTLQPTTFHPQFGLSIPAQCIVFSYQGKLPCEVTTELRW